MRVEGTVDIERAREVVYAGYPDLPGSIANGSLIFEIETGVDLISQIKSFRVVDERKNM